MTNSAVFPDKHRSANSGPSGFRQAFLLQIAITSLLLVAPLAAQVDRAAAKMVGPHVVVRAERAIFRWPAPQGSKLRVDFGTSTAFGTQADGGPTTNASGVVLYEASLEGLTIGTQYYYKATLYRESGTVIKTQAETQVLSFRTPHVSVRVRPVRLDVKKDGDTDIAGNTNKGEAEFSWRIDIDPDSPVWPGGPPLMGCFPGGGSVTVTGPSGPDVEFPSGSYDPNPPPSQTLAETIGGAIVTKLGELSPPTYTTPSCVPDESAPFMEVSPKRAKVKGGGSIDLEDPPIEWQLPDGLPLPVSSQLASQASAPASSQAVRGAAVVRGGARTARARPPTAAGRSSDVEQPGSGKQGANENAGGTGSPPSSGQPCEAPATRHAYVALQARVRGSERDKIDNPITGGQDVTVNTTKASKQEVLCLDLRAPDGLKMLGVRAKSGNFDFTVWFQVDLIYDPS